MFDTRKYLPGFGLRRSNSIPLPNKFFSFSVPWSLVSKVNVLGNSDEICSFH